jgi:hypothetical protein
MWKYGLLGLFAVVMVYLLASSSPGAGSGAATLHLPPAQGQLAPGVAAMCAGRLPQQPTAPAAAAAATPLPLGGKGDTPNSVFSRIYSTLRWSADGGGSGTGSTMSATATLRAYLEMLVYRHQITRVLDAPCGSSHWWPELLGRLRSVVPCFTYSGVDVVSSVVEASKAAYAHDPLTTFQLADLSAPGVGALLRAGSGSGGFDLALCRDALQHLPMPLAVSVLENLGATGARLIALGSYLEETSNHDIPLGEYYKINLLLPPFSLNESSAVDVINEASKSKSERKYLLLFPGEYIAGLDFAAMRARVKAFTGRQRSAASSSGQGLLGGI